MTPKERRKEIRNCRTLAREWLWFARRTLRRVEGSSDPAMWMNVVLENICLAIKYRDRARHLAQGGDP